MSLNDEIKVARKEIVSDGYDMSIGEVMNLYRDNELTINPDFQRLFRWDDTRKTRFIESILLGIPIPPIFVFQDSEGVWELIDGLQRLSTIFEFSGELLDEDGKRKPPSILEGTKFLPSLSGKSWEKWDSNSDPIEKSLQLQIKRARIRVEILLHESDKNAKYELFQRLNTGGAKLSEQEVRSCVAIMVNKPFQEKLKSLSSHPAFTNTITITDTAKERQFDLELVLRFLAFRNVGYVKGLDVHEYLDQALLNMAENASFDLDSEADAFKSTFDLIDSALSENAFKKFEDGQHKGKFLYSLYEVLTFGISTNLSEYQKLGNDDQISIIRDRTNKLWDNHEFSENSGAGVRGTTRLANLLDFSKEYYKP